MTSAAGVNPAATRGAGAAMASAAAVNPAAT